MDNPSNPAFTPAYPLGKLKGLILNLFYTQAIFNISLCNTHREPI
jgi:hypothetical protein